MDRPLRIGLTGGIASGKSTVADLFAERGVTIIDTDVIARDVVEPGQPALEKIKQTFIFGLFPTIAFRLRTTNDFLAFFSPLYLSTRTSGSVMFSIEAGF